MKKLTSSARIVEIFSTEPLDVCESLLDVAENILKHRRPEAKKTRKPRIAVTHLTSPAAGTTGDAA